MQITLSKSKAIGLTVCLVCFSLACGLQGANSAANTVSNEQPEPTATPRGKGTGSAGEAAKAPDSKGENLLSLAAGAFFVASPKSERAFDNTPINLLFPGMMWRSEETALNNNVFVIETPGVTTLKTIGFDTTHAFATPDENAKDILVEASNTGADTGFQKILETALPIDRKEHSFAVSAEVPARWFKLTVKNNHGSTNATALARIMGYGTQTPGNVPANLTGTYRLVDADTGKPAAEDSDNDIFLKQEATSISGCWRTDGNFRGGIEGTVGKVDWSQDQLGTNDGLMIFGAKNSKMIFWRLKDRGFWALEEYQQVSPKTGDCPQVTGFKETGGAKNAIADDLGKKGRAVIYGINFDYNSDKLREDSKTVLTTIVEILKQNPTWKMSIEGHTDSIGGDAFNQTLSEKRAAAVRAFLVSNGIDQARLSSKGLGLSAPIAPNDTEFGRAKNRRVELVKQ